MLFSGNVTVILYFVNIFDAITDRKKYLIFLRQVSKYIPKTYMPGEARVLSFTEFFSFHFL
jgi:hypothetical protein